MGFLKWAPNHPFLYRIVQNVALFKPSSYRGTPFDPSPAILRFRDPLLRLPDAPGRLGSPTAPGSGAARDATARGAAEPRLPEAADGPGATVRGRWGVGRWDFFKGGSQSKW